MDNPTLNSAGGEAAYDLAALKSHLRILDSAGDTDLTAMADTAVAFLQDYTSRILISSTWTWALDSFGCSRDAADDFWFQRYPSGARRAQWLQLPILPLVSVQSVQYIDSSGQLTTLDPAFYQVDARRGRIAAAPGQAWPATGVGYLSAVLINFTAGYSNRAAVPPKLRHALYMLVGHWWENRETTSLMTVKDVPYGFDALVSEFKDWGA